MRQYSYLPWMAACAVLAWPSAHAHAASTPDAGAKAVLAAQAKPAVKPKLAAHPAPDAPQPAFVGESGTASYYGKAHNGKRTASGTRFNQNELTAAHPWLPFGTRVRVTHAGSGRSVDVVITDRLYSERRIVDLSMAAARQLGMMRQGIATVSLTPA